MARGRIAANRGGQARPPLRLGALRLDADRAAMERTLRVHYSRRIAEACRRAAKPYAVDGKRETSLALGERGWTPHSRERRPHRIGKFASPLNLRASSMQDPVDEQAVNDRDTGAIL